MFFLLKKKQLFNFIEYENNKKKHFFVHGFLTSSYHFYYFLEYGGKLCSEFNKNCFILLRVSISGYVVSLKPKFPREHGFESHHAHYFFILILTFRLLLIIQQLISTIFYLYFTICFNNNLIYFFQKCKLKI